MDCMNRVLTRDLAGLSLAEGTSLGIHESQSRTWENLVGRSHEFWQHFYPKLQKEMNGGLDDVSLDAFWKAVNAVEPSFIRVEADEVTYNLHVMLRFNLELRLIRGELAVKDLPEAWRAESQALLGITPEKDSDGVLQDVHWSAGLVGYFPTYALGNLYGSQFFAAMKKDIPDVMSQVAVGDMQSILNWLREKIHYFGAQYTAQEVFSKCFG
jgi:carboxypeptidase Taq